MSKIAAAGYTLAGDAYSVGVISYYTATGQFTAADTLGFLPTVGWAASSYRGAKGFSRGIATRRSGFALPSGGPSGASYANSVTLLSEAIEVAQSSRFIARARRLGFSDDVISALPGRLRKYGDNIGEIASGGWADESRFLIGRNSLLSTRIQRIAHELGHVLDDIANPGLFGRASQPGFGFRGFYNAERVAYTLQYGRNPIPLTAYNAGMQSHPWTTTAIVSGLVYGTYQLSDYLIGE